MWSIKEANITSVNASHVDHRAGLCWHVPNQSRVQSRHRSPANHLDINWCFETQLVINMPRSELHFTVFRPHSQSGLKYSLCGDRTASISQSVSLYADRPANQGMFLSSCPDRITGLYGECPCVLTGQSNRTKCVRVWGQHSQISPHNLMFWWSSFHLMSKG